MDPNNNQPSVTPVVPPASAGGTPPEPNAQAAPIITTATSSVSSDQSTSTTPAIQNSNSEPATDTMASIDFTRTSNKTAVNPLASTVLGVSDAQPATGTQPTVSSEQSATETQPIMTSTGISITELAAAEAAAPTPAPLQLTAVDKNSTGKDSDKNKFSLKGLLSQWTFWGMLGCAVVALAAIVFSVTRVQSESVEIERADDLQAELDEANRLLVKYGTMLGLKVNEFGRPIEGTEDGDIEKLGIASPEYVYIGEWGLKIKIPKGLKNVSYSFDNAIINEEGEQYASAFCVTGVPSKATYVPAYAQFGDTDNMKLGCLTRYNKGEIPDGQNSAIYTDDDYEYVYSLARFAASGDDSEDQELEAEATKLVQEMLSGENISIF